MLGSFRLIFNILIINVLMCYAPVKLYCMCLFDSMKVNMGAEK